MKTIDEEIVLGLSELTELVEKNMPGEAKDLGEKITTLINENNITCQSRIMEMVRAMPTNSILACDCYRLISAACYRKWNVI